jgi:hypothetical protein
MTTVAMNGVDRGFLGFASFCALAYSRELQSGKGCVDALRSWWVDPAVATLSFAFAICVFDRNERKMGYTEKGRLSTVGWGSFFIAPGSVFMLALAGLLYWGGIAVWVQLVPSVKEIPDGYPESFSGALYLLCEVCSGVWAYDFLFSFIHLAAHHFGWDSHEYHHTKKLDLRARDVLTHDPWDGLLQVLVNILVQRHTPWGSAKSRIARVLHNIIVTWMLTESHAASPTPNVARRLFVGVRRHRAHHLGAPYYQQFFGYLDDFRIKVLQVEREGRE